MTTNRVNHISLEFIESVSEGLQYPPPHRERAPETHSSLPGSVEQRISVVRLRPGIIIRMETTESTHITTNSTLIAKISTEKEAKYH